MITINRATETTMHWITSNGYQSSFSFAKSVEELKRFVAQKLYGGEKIPESFKRGAKLTDWNQVYKLLTKQP